MSEIISKILNECEMNGTAPAYTVKQETYKGSVPLFRKSSPSITSPEHFSCTGNEEIFVVSDLHIASGRNKSGVYPGTENFFADGQFRRFLEYAQNIKKSKRAILIINGDVLDFLRVTEYPGKRKKFSPIRQLNRIISFKPLLKYSNEGLKKLELDKKNEYDDWQNILKKAGIEISREELEKIDKREETYGLGTNNYKSIWKLDRISKGHADFFKGLSQWLNSGNKIFILKGNHDLEWYFLAVRNYFRLLMAELICGDAVQNTEDILTKTVLPNIHFFDDSVVIDNEFYAEHGHRYDKFAFVLDNPFYANSDEIKPQIAQTIQDQINIPFGSFFNRYIINRIELLYPFADNVKPASNIFPLMVRERLSVAIKLLGQIIFLVKRFLTPGTFKYLKFMFARFTMFFLISLVPVAGAAYFIYKYIHYPFLISTGNQGADILDSIKKILFDAVKYTGLLLLSYISSRVIATFQLTEPESLADEALAIFKRNSDYKIITMGHTHNPSEYVFADGRRFYNTGTWIPVIEASSAEMREDKTYTFLHLTRDVDGKLQPSNNGLLMRWNDDAGRPENQVLIERK